MDNKKIDLFYDVMDQAAMLIYEINKSDYLTSLVIAAEILLGYENHQLTLDLVEKINQIFSPLESINSEEVRIAFSLLMIKGFKHLNKYPLDLITPDSISYLFANIINEYFDRDIAILDVALGTGNLLNTINNYYHHDATLIGIEKDELLVRLAKVNCELQNNDIKIYYNDCLDPIYDQVDLIIGDLDSYNIDNEYFPYLVINKFLDNLLDHGIFLYVISNDFFNRANNQKFRNLFPGTLLGLIVLPQTMFVEGHIGRSILIGSKQKISSFEMLVINIPSLNDTEKVNQTLNYLKIWTNKLKGMIK